SHHTTLSLHDALPIWLQDHRANTESGAASATKKRDVVGVSHHSVAGSANDSNNSGCWNSESSVIVSPTTCSTQIANGRCAVSPRSEEHTSELQSPCNL